MKFENTSVTNFEGAFRGMRNPLNSWAKSDSVFGIVDLYDDWEYKVARSWGYKNHPEYYDSEDYIKEDKENEAIALEEDYAKWLRNNGILKTDIGDNSFVDAAYLGPNDLDLAQRLIQGGSEHRKFLRQIFVSVDITAPLFLWKELDTYRIGVTANSTSTMHKLASTPVTIDCFETDDMENVVIYDSDDPTMVVTSSYAFNTYINWLEQLRLNYNKTKDKRYWKELIRLLPESWLQTRTVTMNYENVSNICKQRAFHKLTEWNSFIDWAKTLPYSEELFITRY
jgi:hypothetical protein